MLRLATKQFDRATQPPGSKLPMRNCAGESAPHAPLVVASTRPANVDIGVPAVTDVTPLTVAETG